MQLPVYFWRKVSGISGKSLKNVHIWTSLDPPFDKALYRY